jgi:hypothetical protein
LRSIGSGAAEIAVRTAAYREAQSRADELSHRSVSEFGPVSDPIARFRIREHYQSVIQAYEDCAGLLKAAAEYEIEYLRKAQRGRRGREASNAAVERWNEEVRWINVCHSGSKFMLWGFDNDWDIDRNS